MTFVATPHTFTYVPLNKLGMFVTQGLEGQTRHFSAPPELCGLPFHWFDGAPLPPGKDEGKSMCSFSPLLTTLSFFFHTCYAAIGSSI